jgi:segregation and condensation protein B
MTDQRASGADVDESQEVDELTSLSNDESLNTPVEGATDAYADGLLDGDRDGSTDVSAGADTEVSADIDDESLTGTGLDLSDPDRLMAAIEAVLFVVESPTSVAALASVVQRPTAEVNAAIDRIAVAYDQAGRGVELRWIADGVRIYTRAELSPVVEAFLLDGQRTKLSQAALETLAVIAYRQPVTRGRISAIRGVNVDGVVRTLTTRGLVVEDGLDSDSGAGLFRTTSLFLEKMGMRSLEELPSLAPLLPEIDTLETDEL